MMASQTDWHDVADQQARNIEKVKGVKILVDHAIVGDVARMIGLGLKNFHIPHPNSAKVAGLAAFWFNKLRPFSIDQASKRYFLQVNEVAALLIGLALCQLASKRPLHLSDRLMGDWITNFRYHVTSPHSSVTSFELFRYSREEQDMQQ